jgi:hypothetical protein
VYPEYCSDFTTQEGHTQLVARSSTTANRLAGGGHQSVNSSSNVANVGITVNKRCASNDESTNVVISKQ